MELHKHYEGPAGNSVDPNAYDIPEGYNIPDGAYVLINGQQWVRNGAYLLPSSGSGIPTSFYKDVSTYNTDPSKALTGTVAVTPTSTTPPPPGGYIGQDGKTYDSN